MVTIQDIENGSYYWETMESHANNHVTMSDFIENELPDDVIIHSVDGTLAEIEFPDGRIFHISVYGNGDFTHHRADFESI